MKLVEKLRQTASKVQDERLEEAVNAARMLMASAASEGKNRIDFHLHEVVCLYSFRERMEKQFGVTVRDATPEKYLDYTWTKRRNHDRQQLVTICW